MVVVLDGNALTTARDFHSAIARQLDFDPYYGHNLDALWDSLTVNTERPVKLIWMNSAISAAKLGKAFYDIVGTLRDVEKQDKEFGRKERFEFELR